MALLTRPVFVYLIEVGSSDGLAERCMVSRLEPRRAMEFVNVLRPLEAVLLGSASTMWLADDLPDWRWRRLMLLGMMS